MKIKITSALLVLFVARVSGQAEFGECKDFGIITPNDCAADCKSRASGRRRRWSTKTRNDADGKLTECECTYTTDNNPKKNGLPAEGIFTCTSEGISDEPPVSTSEECPDSIKTWKQCQTYCKSLSNNFHVSFKGRSRDDLTKCICDYGPNRQNNYTCTRTRGMESYLRSN